MKSLQIYEPMMKVITKDEKILFYPKKMHEVMKNYLEKNKFVEIEGVLMAVWNIKTIEHDEQAGSNEIPKEFRDDIKSRSKQYQENLGKPPSIEVKMIWVEKLRNGENIFN